MSRKSMILFPFIYLLAFATHAGPYTGTSVACGPVNTADPCKIDLTDFFKSQFTHVNNGFTYTSDSTNLQAAANSANTSSFRYIKMAGHRTYNYTTDVYETPTSDVTIKSGFMVHPRFPNVLMHSKTGENVIQGGPLEMFRWAGGNDNALYVLNEPQWKIMPENISGYFSFMQELGPNINWRNRGSFWGDKTFEVTKNPRNPNEWLSAVRSWNGSGYDKINLSGAKYATASPGSPVSIVMKYYPSVSGTGTWINDIGGGELPTTPMEVLEVIFRVHDSADGPIHWWEKFSYARQKQSNGSYNYFGIIRWQSTLDYSATDGTPAHNLLYTHKCLNGAPPAAKPHAECGEFDLILGYDLHQNAFSSVAASTLSTTVKQWYDTALLPGNKAKNDPKLTKRSTPEDAALPHNRGGFVPPGSGNDAKNVYFGGSSSAPPGEMLYLENTTVEQDWYIYPNGKDPLFLLAASPTASPTNYCREGYNYLASFPVTKSYNGLNGTVEDTGMLHWIIVCGTSTDAYFHGSNGGAEPSCNSGYVTRGWFGKPSSVSMTTCVPGGACIDATAKAYINFCVSQNETDFTYPAPNL